MAVVVLLVLVYSIWPARSGKVVPNLPAPSTKMALAPTSVQTPTPASLTTAPPKDKTEAEKFRCKMLLENEHHIDPESELGKEQAPLLCK